MPLPATLSCCLSWLLAACLLLLPCALAAPPPLPASAPAPMLATPWRAGIEVSSYWVSEKLDGVRARWDGQALWTRAGHRIAAPPWFTRGWPPQPLDGELWAGRDRFEQASATVRRQLADAAAWHQLRFMVFDLPAHPGPFEQRLAKLRALLIPSPAPTLALIEQRRYADEAALRQRLQTVVAGGGEGLMLHHRDNRYRAGRSEGLIKLKPWEDAEARVVAHLPGKGKYAGLLGALLVERPDGTRFRLGSGFTDAERAAPPALGSQVTYRYNGLTARGLPRFARFLRVRNEEPAGPATR